jgi:hypothetical protein
LVRSRNRTLPLVALLILSGVVLPAAQIPLAGTWQLQLDPKDEGVNARIWEKPLEDAIQLPSTTALAGKGQPLSIPINLERPAMQSLHQRFRYVGPAWYRRTVKVPADWKDQDVILTLERVIWESRVWVNGHEAGTPQLSLTTPHRHNVTRFLKPGAENTLTIRIDNREKVAIGVLGHSYTDETQTIWNGIVGHIALEAKPKLRMESLRLRPSLASNGVTATVRFVNNSGQAQNTSLALNPSTATGALVRGVEIPVGESSQSFFLQLPADAARWSEFNPVTHTVTATLGKGKAASQLTQSFGLREFKAAGRAFTINGQRTFLRGTVQCAEFPQTGHPDMTGAQWEKMFTTAKAYGLNHLRFHSWCPPEVAFAAADRHGFYLQVELPNWTFKMGKNPAVDAWLKSEALNIFREYGNHPSFVMLSLGNELAGDFNYLDTCIAEYRQLEPQLLFTSTTFAFAPRGKLPGPQDNFFISQETQCGWVRGQGFLNNTKPNTTSDYAEGAACIPIPLVTHEVGQYVVYPNLAELPKYDSTPLRATAWEAIQADLEKKGRLGEAARYTRDSGKLAVLLYKEDVERALRTKDLSGIQLLQLQDFPGQSTATVGLLDAFWDSKGLVTPEEFRRFCSPTVPLIRMPKMVFQNDETFEAAVEVAQFGAAPLTNATVVWRVRDGGGIVGEGKFVSPLIPLGNGFSLGRIVQPLSAVARPAKLDVTVEISGTAVRNDWSIWVYPAKAAEPTGNVQILTSAGDECFAALREGRKVLLLPGKKAVRAPLDGRFIPVFWSPLHFPNQPGTLGAMIDAAHPVWREFPTGTHTDWQWWELLSRSFALDLDALSVRPSMPFRFVDKYNRNALPAGIFEAKVGDGRLLVCTLDITQDLDNRLAARQLRRSILAYMAGGEFLPQTELTESQIKSMFVTAGPNVARCKVEASSSHDEYPAEQAVDGDPKTFWHSDWMTGDALPATFTLELPEPALLRGFRYTPRQDMNRGRIAEYSIEVSQDGQQWLAWVNEGKFPDTADKQTVTFAQPVKARFLRLTTQSDHGEANHAAIAEIEPVAEEITPDVRDLGIVPGFNDAK